MKDTQRLKSEMFMRVNDFGRAEAASFHAGSLGQKLFADLALVITDFNGHAARQSSGKSSAEQGTTSKSEARDTLRADLEAISNTARAIAEERPGLDDKFRLPRGNVSDQVFVATARAFLADALPLKADFIEYGLPADFLEDLDADITAFVAATDSQTVGQRERVTATAALDQTIERGMQLARRLDAIVRNVFRDDPARLAAWESARHVERLPRHKKPATPPPPPKP